MNAFTGLGIIIALGAIAFAGMPASYVFVFVATFVGILGIGYENNWGSVIHKEKKR